MGSLLVMLLCVGDVVSGVAMCVVMVNGVIVCVNVVMCHVVMVMWIVICG